jgi:teichuronic acid biosynthesis glycosyltransferase TuaH
VLFITDDWVAGAALMGLSPRFILRTVCVNISRADDIVVVSPALEDRVRLWWTEHSRPREGRKPLPPIHVIPNGAPSIDTGGCEASREPRAVLVGQINARTDLELLAAVLAAGIPTTVVGPLTEPDETFRARWAELSADPLLDWRGRVPAAEVSRYLRTASVGLTPYAKSTFNTSSSPLKTMEYLAAGLRVVSSDLPASRLIGAPTVLVANTPADFADAVCAVIEGRAGSVSSDESRAVAEQNSWAVRSAQFAAILTERQ